MDNHEFEEGYEHAMYDPTDWEDCPYKEGSEKYNAWMLGFEQACFELDEMDPEPFCEQ